MTISLDRLPEELVFSICKLLSAKDILSLIACCRHMKNVENSEQLWKFLCKRDYGVDSVHLWYGWLYKEFYIKVLHRLRHFLGFWWRKQEPYGGLLKIEVNKYGVSAYDCLTPIDDSYKSVASVERRIIVVEDPQTGERLHNLRYRLIFSFKPVGKDVHCFCYQSKLGHLDRIGHSPVIGSSEVSLIISPERKVLPMKKEVKSMFFDEEDYDDSSDEEQTPETLDNSKCIISIDDHADDASVSLYWFEIEHGFKPVSSEDTNEILNEFYREIVYHDKIRKFETLTKLSNIYELYPLDFQKESDVKTTLLIKPALYFGTYSSHGWEIIDVRYDNDKQSLEGVKITGDANVFATKVTFRVFCDKPLQFSKADQLNFESINAALMRNQATNYKEADIERFYDKPQDFVIPAEALDPNVQIFEQCYHRRLGEGQIAFNNFENATFTPIIFVAFSEDCFGLLWIELNEFSQFYRVKNLRESAKNL